MDDIRLGCLKYASDDNNLPLNEEVHFILVWDSNSVIARSESAKKKREIYESNLKKEDLHLQHLPEEANGLNFVKITASLPVLKRYAEILKLRLPMKKFNHIKEIKVEDFKISIFSEVYNGIQNSLCKLLVPFQLKNEIAQKNSLTAVFSRDKEYLFDAENPNFFTAATKSRIIEFILKRKRIANDDNDEFAFGIDKCINDGIYVAAYPLHDGEINTAGTTRNFLYREWASFKKIVKFQPLEVVQDYFGVKIAIYFAWLGFYNAMLIPPSVMGFLVFLYGLIFNENDIPSEDICAASKIRICPACDSFCKFWNLNEICLHSKIMYLFDNETSVLFAVFMSFWAALFLEFWKRYSAEIAHKWDVSTYHPEAEHPRPQYLAQLSNVKEKTINFVTQTAEPKPPFWSRKLPGMFISVSMVLFMITLGLIAVVGVILYRMSMMVALSVIDQQVIKTNASVFVSVTGASINLICILIFNQVYGYIAFWLTDLELNRTQTEFDDSLSLKIYLLQFVNYYASIFYIALFKGKFVGYPGEYNRVFGYRQEECSPGGCFMELCVQLAIIFIGKQFLLAIIEYHLPRILKIYNTLKSITQLKKSNQYPQWVLDFRLVGWGTQGLFYEYLEMVIQYGFITIFVSAFPLAPLFALINNVFELRLDAKKLLVHHRRPVSQRVRNIGIWLQILEGLGRIAVVTNAFIIAFTSDFIPRMVYKVNYSSDNSLEGYLDFTLSYFDPKDFDSGSVNATMNAETDFCRYHGYRYPPNHAKKYELTEVHWQVLAARLAFIVVFQNIVALFVMTIKVLVPNISSELKEKMSREAYLTNEIIIRTELLQSKGTQNYEKSCSNPEDENNHFEDEKAKLKRRESLKHLTGDISDNRVVL